MCYVVKMNYDNISYYTVGNKPNQNWREKNHIEINAT